MGVFKQVRIAASIHGQNADATIRRIVQDQVKTGQEYSEQDVARMKSETGKVLDHADAFLDKLEAVEGVQTLDGLTKQATETLGKLEGKYKDVSPERIRSEMQEYVLVRYFEKLQNRSAADLEAIGLSAEQVTLVEGLRFGLALSGEEWEANVGAESRAWFERLFSGLREEMKIEKGRPIMELLLPWADPSVSQGLEPGKIDEATMETILGQMNRDQVQAAGHLKDFVEVFKANRGAVINLAVERARLAQISPESYLSAIEDVGRILDGLPSAKMSGRDTYGKLTGLEEIQSLLLLLTAGLTGPEDFVGSPKLQSDYWEAMTVLESIGPAGRLMASLRKTASIWTGSGATDLGSAKAVADDILDKLGK